jgi:hypothetical protein
MAREVVAISADTSEEPFKVVVCARVDNHDIQEIEQTSASNFNKIIKFFAFQNPSRNSKSTYSEKVEIAPLTAPDGLESDADSKGVLDYVENRWSGHFSSLVNRFSPSTIGTGFHAR